MSGEHVPDDLLGAFVDGEMGEQLAIHIADHLDHCPMCSTRAACLEPLAPAFARMVDPVVPEGLTAAVLVAAQHETQTPQTELVVGVAMLAAATALLLVAGDPVGLVAQLAVWADVGSSLGRALLLGLPSPSILLPLTVLLGAAGAMVVARIATEAPIGERGLL